MRTDRRSHRANRGARAGPARGKAPHSPRQIITPKTGAAHPRNGQRAGPSQGAPRLPLTGLLETLETRSRYQTPISSPRTQPQTPAPDAPDRETRVSNSRTHPRTWLPYSDPNPRPRHTPASSPLGGAQCRSAGQSRRQQVQGEGAASENQEQTEQGAHVGARTPRGGALSQPRGPRGQRNSFADGPRRGLRQVPPPDPGPAPGPGTAG